ncbi:hypothetical protein GALL_423080 [mine drainage metagenome]|uniref:Uncharacterized protein n=1 Tax=mine drainage metagenome TaxID=410659 RepID=A0A1J5PX10_9ZZZZ
MARRVEEQQGARKQSLEAGQLAALPLQVVDPATGALCGKSRVAQHRLDVEMAREQPGAAEKFLAPVERAGLAKGAISRVRIGQERRVDDGAPQHGRWPRRRLIHADFARLFGIEQVQGHTGLQASERRPETSMAVAVRISSPSARQLVDSVQAAKTSRRQASSRCAATAAALGLSSRGTRPRQLAWCCRQRRSRRLAVLAVHHNSATQNPNSRLQSSHDPLFRVCRH